MSDTITIETIPAAKCVGILKRGPYEQIGPAFEQLAALMGQHGLWGRHGPMMGLYLDDPFTTAPEQCRGYAVVAVTDETVTWPAEFVSVQAPGGRAAVMTVRGDHAQLGEAWMQFDGQVKADDSLTLAPGASREIYEHVDMDTPANNVTKLVMPLAD